MSVSTRERKGISYENANRVGPEHFNDPVARKSKWTYAIKGSTSSFPYRMVLVHPRRLELHAPALLKFFTLIFIVVSAVPMLIVANIFVVAAMFGDAFVMTCHGGGLIVTGAFFLLSLWLEAAVRPPIIFDRKQDYFRRCRMMGGRASSPESAGKICQLSQVHALQIIGIRIHWRHGDLKTSTYALKLASNDAEKINRTLQRPRVSSTYELNLVLRDGSRINVFSLPNLAQARQQARSLAAFLEKPLWDAA